MTLRSRLQVRANAEGCRLVFDVEVSVSEHLLGQAKPLFCYRIWLAAGVSVVQCNCVGLVCDAGVSVFEHLLSEAKPWFCYRIWLAAGVSVVQRNCLGASVFATCNFSAQF